MKRGFLCLAVIGLLLSGCEAGQRDDHTLHIAVMVSEKRQAEPYLKGIELAAQTARQTCEGYDISYTVYEDFDNYETGAAIVDTIASDPTVTAVLTTDNMDITALAAHICEDAGKLVVAPYAVNDETLTERSYQMVFSTCLSAAQIGQTARTAAGRLGEKRWAVCYADEAFSRQEARSFAAQYIDDVTIVDMVKENALLHDFETVTRRWQQLGVEGVALFAYDKEGLELFMELKTLAPEWDFVGDYVMDDAAYMEASPERMAAFEGFSLVNQFYVEYEDERTEELMALLGTEELIDTWTIHGYNNFQMIVDTAVKRGTNRPELIAQTLHSEGYDGILQTFSFDKNGRYENAKDTFDVFLNGAWQTYELVSEVEER